MADDAGDVVRLRPDDALGDQPQQPDLRRAPGAHSPEMLPEPRDGGGVGLRGVRGLRRRLESRLLGERVPHALDHDDVGGAGGARREVPGGPEEGGRVVLGAHDQPHRRLPQLGDPGDVVHPRGDGVRLGRPPVVHAEELAEDRDHRAQLHQRAQRHHRRHVVRRVATSSATPAPADPPKSPSGPAPNPNRARNASRAASNSSAA